ncbi:hypothetical protein AB5J62_10980 [Amycolatopsis sp. cg5]|uniref:hypothetical protein n=1 Tax=Amycolatopsis sp. cg5 TaxID=3238802 RepID=UPI003524E1A9
MDYVIDPRVDDYIGKLPEWQQAICREVRDLVHAADPEVEETIKRTVQPYFVLRGNVCALLAMFRQIIANNRAGGWRKLKREM